MAPPPQDPPDLDPSAGDEEPDQATTVPLATRRPDPVEPATATVHTATVLGRLWRAPGVTFYFLLVLAGLALLGVAIGQATQVSKASTTGLTIGKSGLVRNADDRWPGVKHRDLIVSVNGTAVLDPPDAIPLLLAAEPGTLELGFRRGTHRWEQSATTTPRSNLERFAIGLRVTIGGLVLIFGAIAFLVRPGLYVSWLCLLTAHAAGAFLLNEIALHDAWPVLAGRAQAIAIMLTGSLCIHLFCVFPRSIPFLRDRPGRAIWLYAPSVAVAAPFMATFPSLELSTVWEVAAVAMRAWLAIATLVAALILWRQYREAKRTQDHEALPQCRALTVGLGFGLVLPAGWNVVRLLVGIGFDPMHIHLNVAPVIIFVLVVGYAFVRHNPLAVDRFTAAVVGYGATTLVLSAAFAGALVGLPLLVGQGGWLDSRPAIVILTLVFAVAFAPVYRFFRVTIDRRFFRDTVDLRQTFRLLEGVKQAVKRGKPVQGRMAALDAALALRTTTAQLWTMNEDGSAIEYTDGRGETPQQTPIALPREAELVKALARDTRARGVEGLAAVSLGGEAQEQLWAIDLVAAAPVLAFGVFTGFLGVGRKRSGAAYTAEELSFLAAVASEVAATMGLEDAAGGQLGRYRIETRLGTGGMAEVFLAWQLGPGGFERKVALKRPLPHLAGDPKCLAMLFDEARIAAQLQHRHIVQIYEIDRSGDAYFISMEYVDGPGLRELLMAARAQSTTVPLAIATAIIAAVLQALGHAHEQLDPQGEPLHIVHRDITPANILLTRRGEVKLTDFGIARAAVRLQSTEQGFAKGTMPYMSPEQARGETVDHRSDLFSAMVVFHELLTGKRPFPFGPVSIQPSPEQLVHPSIPPEQRRVMARALLFDRDCRYPSAGELRNELLEALAPTGPASEEQIAAWSESLLPSEG
ncbi:MAG: protein kinase [Deltaproteobacteria bacterium]|nr:protein kinase [Deltaproteobacteria bacterium]